MVHRLPLNVDFSSNAGIVLPAAPGYERRPWRIVENLPIVKKTVGADLNGAGAESAKGHAGVDNGTN
jgi:hypothetical protein